MIYQDKEAINALESKGKLTVATLPTAGDTITIGSGASQIIYTFVASGNFDEAGEIPIYAADLPATQAAIVAAINGTDGVNEAHSLVTAGEFSSNESIITAIVAGIAGDLIRTDAAFNSANNFFDNPTLGKVLHGLNGTVGAIGDILLYKNNVYTLSANNTASGKNWRKFLMVDPNYSDSLPYDGCAEIVVPLTAADIIGLYETPVIIVPAVSGKLIVIDDIVMKMVRTETAFTGGGAVEFRYTDASGAKVTADIAATVITTAGAATEYAIQKAIITSLIGVVSSPIVMTNADAAFADGTGTAVLTIRYHLI